MLSDTLREGAHGRIFKILFWIIILSFVFAGVGNYLIPRLNTDPVKVGDFKISSQDWSEQYNRQTQTLQRTRGPEATAMLEDKGFVRWLHMQVLENMVDNLALNAETFDSGIRIGDDQVKDTIRRTPAFFKDGKFNNDLYLAVVRNMGASPEYFAEQMRMDLLSNSIRQPVVSLASVPMPFELDNLTRLWTQRRTVDLYTLNPTALADKIEVSDDEVKAFYDAHHDQFMDPANVRFTYVVLSVDELKKGVKADDASVEDYFNQHQDEFTVAEKRDFSQILLKNGEDLKARIETVQNALKGGMSFADAAKKFSEDPNTRDQGGVMGAHSKTELAPQIASAVFALKAAGDVSPVINDETGARILCLNAIEAQHVPPFNELKDDAVQRYVDYTARKEYDEKVATLSDLSFENPDSLDATAKGLELEIKDSGTLRYGDASLAWPLSAPELQKAAFKEENRTSNQNSPAISLGNDAAAVINVSEYHDARLIDFDKSREHARQLCFDQKSADAASKVLSDYAKAVTADPAAALPENVSKREDVELARNSTEVNPVFSQQIFAMPQEPGKAFVIGQNNGSTVMAILKKVGVSAPSENQDVVDQYQRSLMVQYKSERASTMLYKGARELQDIDYNDDAIKMVIQQDSSEK